MDKIIFEKVGKRLKHARELRHITLEDAGKKVDVHKSTVLRWENGETEKIKLPIIEILASYYRVNPVWLMGYDVPMEIESEKSDNDFRTASYNGIDVEGLDEDEIQHLNELAEFYRSKKKNNNSSNK